jgi:hypothetical protein
MATKSGTRTITALVTTPRPVERVITVVERAITAKVRQVVHRIEVVGVARKPRRTMVRVLLSGRR